MNDLEIARTKELEHIRDVAGRYGIRDDELMLFGDSKAKVRLSLLDRLEGEPQGRYVVVTAITPTPLGEGKTVNTVGLSLGLNKIGRKAVCTIRQPSMGPVFGIKGGAAGGGWSQVVPIEDFNLHLTGDFHAIAAAHNLCAAFADTSLLLDNPLDLSAERLTFRRVVDMNDRALREIEIGLGGPLNGVPRLTGFDITSASELMAILGLCEGYRDLRERLERVVVGTDSEGVPVTAKDLRCAGAMAAILKDTVMPTVMQTLEGTLSFVHTGPFANIAHGNSSVIADRMALKVADFVVTEAGFGADMGCEKFFDIKCRSSGLRPDCAVLVCTVRGIKFNSGRYKIVPGKPLPPEMAAENIDDLVAGSENLAAQIDNVRRFGVPVVVAINRFPTDHPGEIEYLLERARELGARDAVVSECHAKGGEGAKDLAEAVAAAADSGESDFRLLYPDEASLTEKIETLAHKIYGAARVEYSSKARRRLEEFERQGWGRLPICMAKTQYSLSHDPKLKGRPRDFEFPIEDVRVAAGAGFVYPLAGKIMTMPGLGRQPGGIGIHLDDDGVIHGLF
ncbi:MAG: formate--tetrahydrofolate ligase [Planctomycetota bacterium]